MTEPDTTHYKWLCGKCGNVVLIPSNIMGPQAEHSERPFCGCVEQGVRMTRVHGKEGEVSL